MKKLIAASSLAACLAAAAPAIAAVQTFGPDAFRFTLDVPDGLTATPGDDGRQLASAGGKAGFTSQIRSGGGRPPAGLADAVGQEMLRKQPECRLLGTRSLAPDRTVMEYEVEVDKDRVRGVLVAEGDRCFTAVYAGSDEQGIASVIKTIKHVR